MQGILGLGIMFAFLVVGGVSPRSEAETPAPSTILVLSDCLATAYGFDPHQNWVVLLEKRMQDRHWPYQVVNISNPGDTTQQGLEKLPAALKAYNPALVIVALGGNDGLRGFPTSFIDKNLSQITQLIQGHPSKMLLVRLGLPTNYGPAYQKQFSDVFIEIAKRYHLSDSLILIDAITGNAKNTQADHLHPKAQAQQAILDTLWPAIERDLTAIATEAGASHD